MKLDPLASAGTPSTVQYHKNAPDANVTSSTRYNNKLADGPHHDFVFGYLTELSITMILISKFITIFILFCNYRTVFLIHLSLGVS